MKGEWVILKAEHKTHKKAYLLLEMKNSTSQVLKPYYWFKPRNSRELYINLLLLEIQDKIKSNMYISYCPNPTCRDYRICPANIIAHFPLLLSWKFAQKISMHNQPSSIYFTWHFCCVLVCVCVCIVSMFTYVDTFVLVRVQMNVEARSWFQVSSPITLFY